MHAESIYQLVRVGIPNCGKCVHLIEGSDFCLKQGQRLIVKSCFTCASKNLIYAITCSECQEQYIGKKSLCQRIALHRSQMNIPKNKKIAFSQYVNICTNINNSRFRIFPCIKSVTIKSVANELVKSCSFFITRYIPLLNAST